MIRNAYAVEDIKAKRFLLPFFFGTHLEAIRAFGQNCADEQTMWYKFPEDFRLYVLGQYNDETGELTSLQRPEYLACAAEFVNNRKPEIVPVPNQPGQTTTVQS